MNEESLSRDIQLPLEQGAEIKDVSSGVERVDQEVQRVVWNGREGVIVGGGRISLDQEAGGTRTIDVAGGKIWIDGNPFAEGEAAHVTPSGEVAVISLDDAGQIMKDIEGSDQDRGALLSENQEALDASAEGEFEGALHAIVNDDQMNKFDKEEKLDGMLVTLEQEASRLHVDTKNNQINLVATLKAGGVEEEEAKDRVGIGVMDKESEDDTPEILAGKRKLAEIREQRSLIESARSEMRKPRSLPPAESAPVQKDEQGENQSQETFNSEVLKGSLTNLCEGLEPLLGQMRVRGENELSELMSRDTLGVMAFHVDKLSQIDFSRPEAFQDAVASLQSITRSIESIGNQSSRGPIREDSESLFGVAHALVDISEKAGDLSARLGAMGANEEVHEIVSTGLRLKERAFEKAGEIRARGSFFRDRERR